jgi:hypothetical protein
MLLRMIREKQQGFRNIFFLGREGGVVVDAKPVVLTPWNPAFNIVSWADPV